MLSSAEDAADSSNSRKTQEISNQFNLTLINPNLRHNNANIKAWKPIKINNKTISCAQTVSSTNNRMGAKTISISLNKNYYYDITNKTESWWTNGDNFSLVQWGTKFLEAVEKVQEL